MENPGERKLLLGECKWKEDVNALAVVNDLLRKREYLPGHYKDFQDTGYLIFARNFSKTTDSVNGKKVKCFSLDTLARLLESFRT